MSLIVNNRDHDILSLSRLCAALVHRYGQGKEIKISRKELRAAEQYKVFQRLEIDERKGTEDVFLKIEP